MLGVSALFIACGQHEPDGAVVRDSAGVTIVDNRAPVDRTGPNLAVDSLPFADIRHGRDETDDFADRLHVARFSAGPIVVADRNRILWFDARGTWLRTTGRSGRGPGEFRQVDLLQTFGDSLLVYDLGMRRVTVFDSAGNLGRVTNLVGTDSSGASFPLAVFSDGRLLLGNYPTPTPRPGGPARLGDPEGRKQDR